MVAERYVRQFLCECIGLHAVWVCEILKEMPTTYAMATLWSELPTQMNVH